MYNPLIRATLPKRKKSFHYFAYDRRKMPVSETIDNVYNFSHRLRNKNEKLCIIV